jgi:hypothetical protein
MSPTSSLVLLLLLQVVCVMHIVFGQNSTSKLAHAERLAQVKATKLETLVKKIERLPGPQNFVPEAWGQQHVATNNAIFSAAMAVTLMRRDANMFVKTARKSGFTGDIVVAVLPGSSQPFLDALKQNGAIVYTIVTECTGSLHAQIWYLPCNTFLILMSNIGLT